jgi:YD repeat-containing protein
MVGMSRPRRYVPEDQNGNLELLDHRLGGQSLRSYEYGYDANGMRTSMRDVDAMHEYYYDSLYQIVQVTHPHVQRPLEQFQYDAVGNWLGGGRVHNELNQLTEDDSCWYEYDLDGNMTLKVHKVSGDSAHFAWDIENKLVEVRKPGMIARYAYDALGRRMSKEVNGEVTQFRYDGDDLILEMDGNDSIGVVTCTASSVMLSAHHRRCFDRLITGSVPLVVSR